MIFNEGEETLPAVPSRFFFPGRRGHPPSQSRAKRLGWSPFPPGKLARNREKTVPKTQKPLRGDAEIICT
jgi:hypothetical protein